MMVATVTLAAGGLVLIVAAVGSPLALATGICLIAIAVYRLWRR